MELASFMVLQKLILRLFWPLLKFVDLNSLGGLYTRSGEDLLMLWLLFSKISNNDDVRIIEVDRGSKKPYPLSRYFHNSESNTTCYHIDVGSNKIVQFGSTSTELRGLGVVKEESCLAASRIDYKYSHNSNLVSSFINDTDPYSLVVVHYGSEALELLRAMILTSKVRSIFIIGNDAGLLGLGDSKIRKELERKGFVFQTRLNSRDDLFVSTESLNGFPSELVESLEIGSLSRWVSQPPDSDYTRPR